MFIHSIINLINNNKNILSNTDTFYFVEYIFNSKNLFFLCNTILRNALLSIDDLFYNNLFIICKTIFQICCTNSYCSNFGFRWFHSEGHTRVIFFEIKSSTGNCSQKLYIILPHWLSIDLDTVNQDWGSFSGVSSFSRSKFLPVVASHVQNAVTRHVSLLRKHVGRNRLKGVNAFS